MFKNKSFVRQTLVCEGEKTFCAKKKYHPRLKKRNIKRKKITLASSKQCVCDDVDGEGRSMTQKCVYKCNKNQAIIT